MNPVTVVVFGDETLPRHGLIRLLSLEPSLKVAGDCEISECVSQLRRHSPDVALFHLPVLRPNINEVIRSVRVASPATKVVILTRDAQRNTLLSYFKAGTSALVSFRSHPQDLAHAIHTAARGDKFLDPLLSDQIMNLIVEPPRAPSSELSQREKQVLWMVARGHTMKEIAGALEISRKSVETYLARCREKLNMRTRAEIVRYALQTGLLTGRSED